MAFKERLSRLKADYNQVGEELLKAKVLVGHGAFGAYRDSEFNMSERTA